MQGTECVIILVVIIDVSVMLLLSQKLTKETHTIRHVHSNSGDVLFVDALWTTCGNGFYYTTPYPSKWEIAAKRATCLP